MEFAQDLRLKFDPYFDVEIWSIYRSWVKLAQVWMLHSSPWNSMWTSRHCCRILYEFLGMIMMIWYIMSLMCNLWYCYNTLYLHTARSNPLLSICHKQAEKNEKQKLRFCKLHKAKIWSRFWNCRSLLKIWDWSSILTLPGIHTCNIFERLWDHRWLQLPNSERKPSERSRFKGYLIWL